MEFRRVHDYMPWIEDIYVLDEYGTLYSRVKSYNGSYKVSLRDKNNKTFAKTVTSLVKPYLNKSTTKQVYQDVWIVEGIPYSKRYITPEHNGYCRVFLKEHKGTKSTDRVRYMLHDLVDFVFNGGSLNLTTHHIDRDKTNNHYTNLVSMTRQEHQRLHMLEDNPKRIYNSFIANHNGIEGLVTCSLLEFERLTGVRYFEVHQGFSTDSDWKFYNYDYKE